MHQAVSRVLVFTIVLSIAPVLLAQTQQGLRDRDQTLDASKTIAADLQKARAHYGPFYLLSSIELSDIGYNQEILAPTSNESGGVALGISAPQRLYFVPSRKQVYSISATPQYAITTGNRSNQFGYLVRGDAQYLLNHLYLDFFGSQSDALDAGTTEINQLTTVRSRTVGLASEIRYSSRTNLAFNASTTTMTHPSSRLQPEDIPVNLLDRTQQDYRLSLRHKTFPLTSLFLAGERSNYHFALTRYKDSKRTYAGAGAVRDSGRSTIRLEGGVAKLDFDDPSQKGFRGAVGNLTTTYRLTGRTNFTASGARDIEFSISPISNYYVMDRAAASIEYIATRKLTLNVTSSGYRDTYPVASFDPLGVFHRRVDTVTFNSVGWMYSLHRIRGGFDVGYYDRTSNFGFDENHGIRLVLHLSLTP